MFTKPFASILILGRRTSGGGAQLSMVPGYVLGTMLRTEISRVDCVRHRPDRRTRQVQFDTGWWRAMLVPDLSKNRQAIMT